MMAGITAVGLPCFDNRSLTEAEIADGGWNY